MIEENEISKIFSLSEEEYGDGYKEKLFEQYRIFLQMIDGLEHRRKVTHSFFLSVNTGLIAVLGISTQIGFTIGPNNFLWLFGGIIAGIMFSYSWYRTIESYIQLSTVKWNIVLEIERKLPLKIHEIEWKILTNNKKSKYKKLTDVESVIPVIFIGLYALLLLGTAIIFLLN